MTKKCPAAATVVCAMAVALALAALIPASAAAETVGRSAQGRPIKAERVGSASAERLILVVGAIHGGELAGRAITDRLRRARPPRGTALILVRDLNPDGAAAGTRQNARGVDLNRNFPFRWRAIGSPFDTYHSGAGPLSEPESQAAAALVRRLRPRATIYYHQALRLVDPAGGDPLLERLYARRTGLAYRDVGFLPGTATSWQNNTFPGDSAFVVELPGGPLSERATDRHARAVLGVAAALAPVPVVSRPIPFDAQRRRDMRGYARRHYGIDDFRLRKPRVIVQHYTASNTFGSAFNTFAQNVRDVELHELPGVCAHFLIDRDGTVAQLVPTNIMCRHTVGLNHRAIGIEHVGTSDGQVLSNRRQLGSSLALTRMLQGQFGIGTRHVIGHNESRSSPYHEERVPRLRSQTHGDFQRRSMDRYRAALEQLPEPATVRPSLAASYPASAPPWS